MLKGRFEKLFIKGLLWIVILFLVGVAVLLAGATWEIRQKERIAHREREYAKEQFAEVSERYGILVQSVENLSNERGLEEEFRRRFPVAREGEEVVVLVDAPPPLSDTESVRSQGFWEALRSWFGW